MPKICLYISPSYYTMFEFVTGTKCCHNVMSTFGHFNVYEDILNNYLLSRVKKKKTKQKPVVIN